MPIPGELVFPATARRLELLPRGQEWNRVSQMLPATGRGLGQLGYVKFSASFLREGLPGTDGCANETVALETRAAPVEITV